MKFVKHLSFCILPALLVNTIELIYYEFDTYLIQNLVENLSIGLVLCLIVEVFKNRLKSFLLIAIYAFHLSFIALESLFYASFNTFFSASAIYIFLETNQAEAQEFINTYVSFNLIAVILVIVILSFSYQKFGLLKKASFFSKHKPLSLILSFIILLILKFTGYIVPNFTYITTRSVVKYYVESQKFKDLKISQPISPDFQVTSKLNDDAQTYVLVIGESTTRSALGIYGNSRNTTPKLSQLSSELEIYNNVISSQTHTIEALRESLTLNHLKAAQDISILQLMNKAGFKTFWLSNQRPVGLHETLLTKISLAADEVVYTNTAKWGSKTPLDEVLLPYLEKALNDSAQKKFIVLNLLATHNEYQKRYPPNFETFTNPPETKFPSTEAYQKINAYHNSVVYVDYLLNEIITKVKAKDALSYVLYFSDHGDEVYKDENFIGHNDGYKATASMFEIPFFLWQSNKYKQLNNLNIAVDRPYVMRDFIHSFIDLSHLKFDAYHPEKSIFSKDFKVNNDRVVGKSIHYDKAFKN